MSSSLSIRRRILSSPDAVTKVVPATGIIDDDIVGDPQPATSLDALLHEARQAGFEDGRRAGLKEGAHSAETARVSAMRQLGNELRTLGARALSERRSVLDEATFELVGLCIDLVEMIVGHELSWSDAPTKDAILRALCLVPEGPSVLVRVHPDCPLSDAEIADLTSSEVRVVRDPSIETTGCVVEVGRCNVDAQAGAALDRVRRCLDDLRKSPAPLRGAG